MQDTGSSVVAMAVVSLFDLAMLAISVERVRRNEDNNPIWLSARQVVGDSLKKGRRHGVGVGWAGAGQRRVRSAA